MWNKFSKDGSFANKKLTPGKFAPAIICFLIVFVLLILPEDTFPHDEGWLQFSFLDKIVHVTMFAFNTFLFLFPVGQSGLPIKFKRHWFLRIAVSMCIWGITTEFIQKFYSPTRAFDLLDWAADSLGILMASLYTWRFHRR